MPNTSPRGELSYRAARVVCELLCEFGYRDVVISERYPSGDRWVTGRIVIEGMQFVITVQEEATLDALRAVLERYRAMERDRTRGE